MSLLESSHWDGLVLYLSNCCLNTSLIAMLYLFDGSMTVDAGAATLLMVVFFGSPGLETDETATGMAVVYSTPEVPDTAAAAPYPSSPPRISSRMVDIESLRVLAS